MKDTKQTQNPILDALLNPRVRAQPGPLATVLGTPVDMTAGALHGLSGGAYNSIPYGGRYHLQNIFTPDFKDQGILEINDSDPRVVAAAKGATKATGESLGWLAGLQAGMPDIGEQDWTRFLTETVGEKKKRVEEEAKTAQENASMEQTKQMLQLLQAQAAMVQAMGGQGFGGQGDGKLVQGSPIPMGGTDSPLGGRINQIENLLGSFNPVEREDADKEAFLQGLLGGVAQADPNAGVGAMLAAAGAGGVGGLKKEKDEKRERDKEGVKAQADALLTIGKLEDAMSQREQPKIHTTKNGVFVERTVDRDGKKVRELVPFTAGTFQRASAFGALGGKGKVNILGSELKLDPNDPLAEEQLILSKLQQANALQSFVNDKGEVENLFGEMLQSPAMNELIVQTQAELMGAAPAQIQDEIMRRKIAFMSSVLAQSPAMRTKAFKAIKNAYGGQEYTDKVLPSTLDSKEE